MSTNVEHELRFAGELLPAHQTEVVGCDLAFLRVVVVAVREVSSPGLVDDGRRGDGGAGGYVPVQDLLVLVVVVQQLEFVLV